MISNAAIAIQLAVGSVFLWASLSKAARPLDFVRGLAEYGLPRPLHAILVGVALVMLEAAIAVAHLSGWLLEWGCLTGICLLGVFGVVSASMLRKRVPVPCLCFGSGNDEIVSVRGIARLGFLLLGEVLVGASWLTGVTWHAYDASGIAEFARALLCGGLILLVAFWAIRIPEAAALRLASVHTSLGKSPKRS